MKMYLISDNIDTQIGMRLAGIDGVVLHDHDGVLETLKKVIADESIGIVMLTEKAAALVRSEVQELKMTLHRPLLVEIPDRHGSRDIAESINNMVQESIGLKL